MATDKKIVKGQNTTRFQRWMEKHPTLDKYTAPVLGVVILVMVILGQVLPKKMGDNDAISVEAESDQAFKSSSTENKEEIRKTIKKASLDLAVEEVIEKSRIILPSFFGSNEEELNLLLKTNFQNSLKKFSIKEQKKIMELAQDKIAKMKEDESSPGLYFILLKLENDFEKIFSTSKKWQEKAKKESKPEKQR